MNVTPTIVMVILGVLCAGAMVLVYILATTNTQTVISVARTYQEELRWFEEEAKEREKGLRDEVKALTESLVRAEGKFLVYPNRQPTEVSEGYFDGKPKIVSAGPMTAADQAILDKRKGGG